jgi:hypothetical protein
MDPIVIPFTFAGLLAVAGLVTYVLVLREDHRNRSQSKSK